MPALHYCNVTSVRQLSPSDLSEDHWALPSSLLAVMLISAAQGLQLLKVLLRTTPDMRRSSWFLQRCLWTIVSSIEVSNHFFFRVANYGLCSTSFLFLFSLFFFCFFLERQRGIHFYFLLLYYFLLDLMPEKLSFSSCQLDVYWDSWLSGMSLKEVVLLVLLISRFMFGFNNPFYFFIPINKTTTKNQEQPSRYWFYANSY